MQRILQDHTEQVKHVADAVAIPAGLITGFSHYIGIVNGVLTTLVLLTSLIWGIYRIIDMHKKNVKPKKKSKKK